jgi:uncharacterized membrane protein
MSAIRTLTLVSAIGAGLSAGVYFTFSAFVVPGIKKLQPAEAIRAMNGVNKAAPASPLLMLVLFGTALLAIATVITALSSGATGAQRTLLIAACVLYLVSVILTGAYHVPRNDALIAYDFSAAGADPAARWSEFLSGWVPWNHVRTLTALAGAVCFTTALRTGNR